LFRLQIVHPQQIGSLAKFDIMQGVNQLHDKIRPDVTRLRKDLIDSGHSGKLIIRVFELSGIANSYTRKSSSFLGEYETGDDCYINGELQPLQFHDTIYDQA
jgi:hypothetical protein